MGSDIFEEVNFEEWVDHPDSEINRIMIKAVFDSSRVKIEDFNGDTYEGVADHFTRADDEEDGFPTICINAEDGDGWCFGENEIKSIEII